MPDPFPSERVSLAPMFTPARAIPAEGARVGIVTCRVCGCALLLDPDDYDDVLMHHRFYHSRRGEDVPNA